MRPIVLIAPTPPPMHGAALATERLLHVLRSSQVKVTHINAKYVDSVEDLGAFSLRKVLKMCAFLWRSTVARIAQPRALFIVEPAMYFGPFLKDAVFVLWLRLLGAKVIAWHHMALESMWSSIGTSAWKRQVVAFTLRRLVHNVVAGSAVSQQLQSIIPSNRISIIPNGIPAEQPDVSPRSSDDPTSNSSEFRVLYLSNMGEAKGYKVLLEVVERLCVQYKQLHVDFYGNTLPGQSVEHLQQEFAQLNCSERIQYHGPVYAQAKANAYARADVFVLPSFNEAFPLTILEAMSVGTAVIATDVGSIADAVEHGTTGFVCNPGSAQDLEKCIVELIEDRQTCRNMGQACQAKFRDRYTLEKFGENWRQFLRTQ